MFFHTRGEWDAPSFLDQLLTSPVKLLLRLLYQTFLLFRSAPPQTKPFIRVVCISDTHTLQKSVPDGDLLIHAGDLTNAGTIEELQTAIDWLSGLPHKHKVVISGNHDTYLDPRSRVTLPDEDRDGKLDWHNIHYLQHSKVTLTFPERNNRQLQVYGAPQLPACGGPEYAFQYPRGQDAWSETVPMNIDVLVTHTPPKYHHDIFGRHGCEWLLKEIWRVKPKLHVFGHIHAAPGQEIVCWERSQEAYEKGTGRASQGLLTQIFDVGLWFHVVQVAYRGFREIMWDQVWGGAQVRTRMVNAALMSQDTGKLEHEAQIVYL